MYLDILHVFYTYPKPVSPRYILGYTSDTSRYKMYLLASYVSHWIHNRIYQDTSRYMYLGLFVKIHQDTT